VAEHPPIADRRPVERTHHGDTLTDEYEWLRDKESPDVLSYLEAENAYTDSRTAHLAGLREAIFEEIRSRTQETDLSVPARIGEFWYFVRTIEGKQYGVRCRAPISGPDDWAPPIPDGNLPGEEVLLDSNELAEGHDFFALGASSVSPATAAMIAALACVSSRKANSTSALTNRVALTGVELILLLQTTASRP